MVLRRRIAVKIACGLRIVLIGSISSTSSEYEPVFSEKHCDTRYDVDPSI